VQPKKIDVRWDSSFRFRPHTEPPAGKVTTGNVVMPINTNEMKRKKKLALLQAPYEKRRSGKLQS
jgi:hypothetical protein